MFLKVIFIICSSFIFYWIGLYVFKTEAVSYYTVMSSYIILAAHYIYKMYRLDEEELEKKMFKES